MLYNYIVVIGVIGKLIYFMMPLRGSAGGTLGGVGKYRN